ncbi:hypothetical protein FPV67DRAFT_1564063 [Lyophyllum atratum]|nr:hypothetical protein FPV67DRAFT_1564063 [Lyophyllum atratum]
MKANLVFYHRPSSRSQASGETRQRNLPYLPPELWILIFRYATSSCSTQECFSRTVSFLSLAHSHSHLQHRLSHYRAVMRRKAAMTLVCKDWYTFAQEVLFEFVWISRASEARALAAILERDGPGASNGQYIRRLHIETPSLERCCPVDLRTILDCAPRLVVYSDYRSVRRNIYEESCNPRSSPQQLLSALAHPNNSLRRLSWTNYDDVSFHLHMSPMLETTATNLEFLELNFCSSHLHSMSSSSPSLCPEAITLTLPALRSLKVTLDNATFAVLSSWSMPSLQNLSVLSADFSYASSGFSQFFMVHGPKLTQLELGHSSSTIEEHYLTALPSTTGPHPQGSTSSPSIPLAAWCPNLVEFICSADAEWNWQHPDWIAPHVLLPTHPTLQFIGIRDLDKRIRDDMTMQQAGEEPFFMLLEQVGSLLRRDFFPALLYIRDMSWESDLMRRGVGVLRFWQCVLERCRAGGVWMEDFKGVNVTMRDLRRAEAGKGGGAGKLEFGTVDGVGW